MLKLRHFTHPLRSAMSLLNRSKRYVYDKLIDYEFRNIKRDKRTFCWCGGELRPFVWHDSYGICSECESYVNVIPPHHQEISKIYSNDCYWGYVSKLRGWPTLQKRSELYIADGRLDHWVRLVEKFHGKTGTVIEVGCAPGVLLRELQRKGYHCVGIEADETVSDWISEHMGVEVITMLFPDTTFNLPKCELFIAFDVLEHVFDPAAFLMQAYEILTPGGIAIIQAPINRYDYEPPFGYEVPVVFSDIEHLFVFVDKAMIKLGQKAGFNIVSLDEIPWRIGHEICVYQKPHV